MRPLSTIFIIVMWVSSVGYAQTSGLPEGIKNTQNPKDISLTPAESLKRITVGQGFHVTLFAGEPDVAQPIAMTFDDRGRLWVVENFSHPKWKPTGKDRIVILEDTNNDGKFDNRKVFFDKGNYLTGIALGFGGVWICNVPNLMFIPDKNRDDVPDGDPITYLDGWARNNTNNVLNNLIWGPDGWLYGCSGVGASSHVGKPGTPKQERIQIARGTWRYHPTRHVFEVLTHGAVNPWGMDFNDYGEAFSTNCVLAHLWHLIPGAYFTRRPGESDKVFTSGRIRTISDHLHWGGGSWTSSRGGKGKHNKPGGGHAHTGAMIYLGDNWPEKYRNTFFTGNLHGNRINNDLIERQGSGFVGRHGKDFLMGNDPWFRCLTQKYGPDGGVFMSDWHDFGECHDSDGSHRTSGRIYKVVYGKTKTLSAFDVAKLADAELVKMQLHKNDWFVRHARRVLQERAVSGKQMSEVHISLKEIFNSNPDVTRKLRAMWALYVTKGLAESDLLAHLDHENQYVRTWAIRMLCDQKNPSSAALKKFARMAQKDNSARVRLYLASSLQRMPLAERWAIATELAHRAEDEQDKNIPLMIWFGIEPAVSKDTQRALKLAGSTKISLLRKFIARRVAASSK